MKKKTEKLLNFVNHPGIDLNGKKNCQIKS